MFRGRNMPFHVYRPYPFREKVSPSIRNDLRRLGVRFERRLGSRTDAILSLVTLKVDAALMKRAPQLRVVANVAVGYDNVDVPEATRRGIVVTNTPDVLTEATADLAWALILAAARRVVEGDRFVRAGRFKRWDFEGFRGADLHGKTLGILGAGRIGQAVGHRATGFSMKVLYAGRSRRRDFERRVGARRVGLQALLRGSDFVSIHVPLTPETRGMIGARELRLLRPTAVLVNTSRGPVVDEQALAHALRSGRLAAAGLDVYEREPEVHPALLGLPNVTLLPHIGSSTDATRRGMLEIALRNLAAALRGRVPPNAVNPGALPRRARRT